MTPQDIEAELSYAYLHAVASHASVACQVASRMHDGLGIDAMLTLRHDFGPPAILTDITLHLQLKATTRTPVHNDGRFSYFLKDAQEYERLRKASSLPPRLLAVLFLPTPQADWLTCAAEQLVLRKCAYWTSLRGAPASKNDSGQTVYLPDTQVLSPDGLRALFERVAHQEELLYVP